jgi:hypothetical protein
MTMKNTLLSATILALFTTATANAGPKPSSGPKMGGFQPSNMIHSLPIQNIGKSNGPTQTGQVLNLHTPTGQMLKLHPSGVPFNPLLKTGNGQPHGVQILGPQNSNFKTFDKKFTPFCYPPYYCSYPWWFGCGYWGYPSYGWWDSCYFPFCGF